MKRILYLMFIVFLIFPSCHRSKITPKTQTTSSSFTQNIIITPNGIPTDYEIVGHVEVAGGRSSNIRGLYKRLGDERKKMGGDMVINVRAGQDIEDATSFDSLPKGCGDDPYRPVYTKSYGWGKGTIIRIKEKHARKAYLDAQKRGEPRRSMCNRRITVPLTV